MNIADKVRLLGNLRQGERVELGLQREIFGELGSKIEHSTQLGYFARIAPAEEVRVGPIESIFDTLNVGPSEPRLVLYSEMLANGNFEGNALYVPVSVVEYFRCGFSSPAGGISDTFGLKGASAKIWLEP